MIEQVEEIVRGRRDNYGRPLINFLRIALKWTNHLQSLGMLQEDRFISPENVAWMMVELKQARAEHSWTDDSVLDSIGYMDCLDDMNQHMIELGFTGVSDFKLMPQQELVELLHRLTQTTP